MYVPMYICINVTLSAFQLEGSKLSDVNKSKTALTSQMNYI